MLNSWVSDNKHNFVIRQSKQALEKIAKSKKVWGTEMETTVGVFLKPLKTKGNGSLLRFPLQRFAFISCLWDTTESKERSPLCCHQNRCPQWRMSHLISVRIFHHILRNKEVESPPQWKYRRHTNLAEVLTIPRLSICKWHSCKSERYPLCSASAVRCYNAPWFTFSFYFTKISQNVILFIVMLWPTSEKQCG